MDVTTYAQRPRLQRYAPVIPDMSFILMAPPASVSLICRAAFGGGGGGGGEKGYRPP